VAFFLLPVYCTEVKAIGNGLRLLILPHRSSSSTKLSCERGRDPRKGLASFESAITLYGSRSPRSTCSSLTRTKSNSILSSDHSFCGTSNPVSVATSIGAEACAHFLGSERCQLSSYITSLCIYTEPVLTCVFIIGIIGIHICICESNEISSPEQECR
jgi:hypothetical protein